MDFVQNPCPSPSFFFGSFGNFVDKVKQFGTLAVSAIIGNIFSAILTFCFALGLFFVSDYCSNFFICFFFGVNLHCQCVVWWCFVISFFNLLEMRKIWFGYVKFGRKNETFDLGVCGILLIGLDVHCFGYFFGFLTLRCDICVF